MANPDLTDVQERKRIIEAINSNENKTRKRNEQRKHDIYRKHLRNYVTERLTDEFDRDTVNSMRKITSINPAKRIVDEQASLYVDEPNRHWIDASEKEKTQLDDLYRYADINPQLRLANRYYKLHGQCALYCLPRLGKLTVRALSPKDYDVVPDADDAERAFAYVLNVVDPETERINNLTKAEAAERRYDVRGASNSVIADKLDAQAAQARYVWWSDEYHFTTDGNGIVLNDNPDFDAEDNTVNIANPIGRMPFVDIANEKDFRFFVEVGSDVVDFTIDLAVQLSDLAQTAKFQAYSQAIIYSVDEPQGIQVGPNRIIWLKVDPTADGAQRPEFKFENPSPDLAGTLEILNAQLKMFLTSQGLSPGTVSGKNEIEKFTSGIDHLLSNLDKFKATREDMDLFRQVENTLLELLIAWQDVMFDVSDNEALDDIFVQSRIGDQIYLDLVFHEPEAVQTDSETLEYVQAAVQAGLMTKLEAVKRIYKVDQDTAEGIIEELAAEKEAADQKAQIEVTEELHGRALPGAVPGEIEPEGAGAAAQAPSGQAPPPNPEQVPA